LADGLGEADLGKARLPGPAEIRRLCHDLNNPLAVIMGHLEIVAGRYRELPGDLKRRLEEIGKSASEMRELIMSAGQEARRAMNAGD
jgi:signal transduction histidine kinase